MINQIKECKQIVDACLDLYKRHGASAATHAQRQLRDDVETDVNCRLVALKQRLIALDDPVAKGVIVTPEFAKALIATLHLLQQQYAVLAVLEEGLKSEDKAVVSVIAGDKNYVLKLVIGLLKVFNEDLVFVGLQFVNTYLRVVGPTCAGVARQGMSDLLKGIAEKAAAKQKTAGAQSSVLWVVEELTEQIMLKFITAE